MNHKILATGDGHPQAALTLNVHRNFIAEAIQGQVSGIRLIRELGDALCHVDKLFSEVQALADFPVALRGFCRVLQKHIENGGVR